MQLMDKLLDNPDLKDYIEFLGPQNLWVDLHENKVTPNKKKFLGSAIWASFTDTEQESFIREIMDEFDLSSKQEIGLLEIFLFFKPYLIDAVNEIKSAP